MAKRKTAPKTRSTRSTKSPNKNKNKNKKINFASKFKRTTLVIFALVFANVGALTLVFSQASSSGLSNSVEIDQYNRINNHRASHGKGALYRSGCITDFARIHAKTMSDKDNLHHSNYGPSVSYACSDGSNWTAMAENVGLSYVGSAGLMGASASVFQEYLNSPGHHATIDDSGNYRFNFVGTAGYQSSNNKLWTVQIYATCNNCAGRWDDAPSYAGEPSSNTPAPETISSYSFGESTDIGLICDWDGDGVDTPGVYRPSNNNFYIKNSHGGGNADITFKFGQAGDVPICGDWDGNGTDTVGIVRGNTWYLRNSNSGGNAEISFSYGKTSDSPIVGDWDGNGTDTIGIVRGNTWYLRNSNSGGKAQVSFSYGQSTDYRLSGAAKAGIKSDNAIVRRGNVFYLR